MDEPVLMSTSQAPFISFSDLLKVSWENVKRNLKNIVSLFLLSCGFALGSMIILVMIGLVLVSSHLPAIREAIAGGSWQSLGSLFTPELIVGLVGALAVLIVMGVILGLAIQIAQVKIYSDPETKSIWDQLKTSLPLIPPMIGLGFLMQFLSLGGTFLFLIPGILIVIYLSLSYFELIIGNKKVIPAMVGSYQIMRQHFGDIFLRYLAVYVPYFIVFGIIPEILNKYEYVFVNIVNFLLALAGNLFVIFGMAYGVELYKEASKKN